MASAGQHGRSGRGGVTVSGPVSGNLTPISTQHLFTPMLSRRPVCYIYFRDVTLGVEAAAIATVRQQLINKGMVWSQRHGETAFTVPLFNEFMKRQMPDLEKHQPKRRPRRRR